MTAPTHSVKYVRKRYRKFQIVAAVCAALTIAAAFLAAVSGIRIAFLEKQQSPSAANRLSSDLKTENELIQQIEKLNAELTALKKQQSPNATDKLSSDLKTENELIQQINALLDELAAEKSTVRTLRLRVTELERHLAAMNKSISPDATPQPLPAPAPAPKPAPVPQPSEIKTEPKASTPSVSEPLVPPESSATTPQPTVPSNGTPSQPPGEKPLVTEEIPPDSSIKQPE